MFEIIRDFFDTTSSRVRSPIFGMIALVFFLLNWKPLYYLFFVDTPAAVRLRFFDMDTGIWTGIVIPIIVGFFGAIAYPWVAYIGATLVTVPVGKYRDLQEVEKQSRELNAKRHRLKIQIVESKMEAESERALIERAKRSQEVQAIDDDKIRSVLEKEIVTSREDAIDRERQRILTTAINKLVSGEVNDYHGERMLLSLAAGEPAGAISVADLGGSFNIIIGKFIISLDNRKNFMKVQSWLKSLEVGRYIFESAENAWTVTDEGYKAATVN